MHLAPRAPCCTHRGSSRSGTTPHYTGTATHTLQEVSVLQFINKILEKECFQGMGVGAPARLDVEGLVRVSAMYMYVGGEGVATPSEVPGGCPAASACLCGVWLLCKNRIWGWLAGGRAQDLSGHLLSWPLAAQTPVDSAQRGAQEVPAQAALKWPPAPGVRARGGGW